jgi:hypothetical protein
MCYQEVAATCLFLACKIEESMRKCQDFIIKTAKVAMKNPSANIEPGSKVPIHILSYCIMIHL